MTQWWSSAYNDLVSQLPQSIVDCLKLRIQNTKIRGNKYELNEESDNLNGLFEKELASYNNKKQCMKMNNKRYEERLLFWSFPEFLTFKKHALFTETFHWLFFMTFIGDFYGLRTSATGIAGGEREKLEEMQKALENKDQFIAKQMILIQAFNERFVQLGLKIEKQTPHHYYHLKPCRGPGDTATKIWRIKIGTHRERGTKQTTEQRPEKKPDLLNMEDNDVSGVLDDYLFACKFRKQKFSRNSPNALAERIWRQEMNVLSEEFM
ncbi:hypothetical protein PROFUN_02637 [Planoprotostelium fungivorum]|uniref:Uncharacterized protein n=1 Tax=Planoprotostelium fungivorum TaxID=1890364 RepID=A0A2P6NVE0_9EUKA|nr:hypothetical protein PROFUN_02637 [Planoprotostelium fungivorum]